MLAKPSDIGFEQDGFELPPLNFIEKTIITESRDNGQLFNDIAISATNFNAELRITRVERLSEAAAIANHSNENFIVWIKQNEEGDEMVRLIPGAVNVQGSDSIEVKEKRLLGFAENEFRVMVRANPSRATEPLCVR